MYLSKSDINNLSWITRYFSNSVSAFALAISAVILGEKIHSEEWFTYIPIWCAVGILVLEGMWHIYLQQRKRQALITNIEKFSERTASHRKDE